MRYLADKKGVTFIELMVVLAIIGIAVTLATMGSDTVRKHRLTAASRGLLGDLQKIRQDAMTRVSGANSRGHGIRFTSSNSYTIFEFSDINNNFVYDDTGEETAGRSEALPTSSTVTIGNATNPTGDVLIYDKRGMARDSAWSQVTSKTYVLRLTGVTEVRCILIEAVRIREGTWDGLNCNIS